MAEEEIGDKGGGTISDTKCVNIVNEDNPSLEKDIQLTTALEKTESLVSTRNASLVGLRRMMFENISHTDDEKLPKFRKLSYEKSFQESQKSDRKSDFIIKDLSENNSASVKLSEANLVKSENKTNNDSFLTQSNLDKSRYSDISFIDKESDQEECDKVVEKNALVDEASLKHKESQDALDNSNKLTKEQFNLDNPVVVQDVEVDVPIVLQENSDHLEVKVEANDKLIDNLNSLTIVAQNVDTDNEFIDVKVDDEENILIETKNNSIAISEPFREAKNNTIDIPEEFVEAKNDTICQNLVVEATNDVVCESFIYEKTKLAKLTEPTEVSSDLEPTADTTPIPPARGKAKDKVIAQFSPTKPIEKNQPSSPEYPEDLNPFGEEDIENVTISTNPFGSSDDEDEKDVSAEAPTPHKRKLLHAPKISLNPFGSDSDEEFTDEDISSAAPVPMPRSLRTPEPSPLPRSKLRASKGSLGSATSLGSRKKKHAPLPPPLQSPKTRKGRQAPRPPPVPRTVSPSQPPPLPTSPPPSSPPSSFQYIPATPPSSEKNNKDYVNRQRQNSETSSIGSYMLNKSTYGQWKRKKGPAPALPIPQRRLVKPMPIKDIRQELDDIEIKQQELERQGVKLEQTIRDKFELDSSLTPYVEEMVLQLFELVNEKNELFRRQAELMYLRRQHNLEEEHAELEYQIRCLMLCPDHNKTDSDKAREEELIHRLVEVVERRDEIIQCLEMDRLREAEEDRSVNTQLGIFSAAMGSELDLRTKSDKKEKKTKKEKKMIKKETLDVDKDVDEMDKERKKHKKKWFTLHHKT